MYKNKLTDDLRAIFGVKKIIYASVDSGKEQGAIYVDIEEVKQNVQYGRQRFIVRLNLGMWGAKEGYPNGFFKNRLREAMKKGNLKERCSRFLVLGKEENIKFPDYEGYFSQTSIPMFYTVSLDYDPAKKTKGVEVVLNLIKGVFKK